FRLTTRPPTAPYPLSLHDALRILGDAGEVGFVIGACVERQAARQIGEALVPAIISREEHVALAEAIVLDLLGELADQDGAVDPIRRRQRVRRDRLQPAEKGL